MTRNGARPRRLRVSALAAVANPSYTRIDTWNLLDDACRHLAEVDLAGLDKAHDLARVKRLMDRIGAYERYWLYPGAQNLATFRAHLESLSTVRLSEEVSLAVRLLSEYGDRTALFDTSAPLADQELVAQAKQQQFYTVLLADDAPSTAPDCLAESLRALRDPSDDVQFELLVVPSVEDAITAVALNGEIQAAIIRHDLPLRSRDRVPLMNTLLGASDNAVMHRPRPRLGRMRRVDPGAAAAHRPLPAHRRVDRGGQRRRARRLRPDVLSAQRRHRSAQHGARGLAESFRHTVFRRAARLRGGAGRPVPRAAHRARRQHLQLEVAAGHGRVLRPQHLHGRDLDHLGWPGLAAGPARQHQESDGQGRAHLELRPHLLRHQRNVDRQQDRRAVADPAGRHRADRPQLPQVAPLRPGAGRRVPAVPGRLSVAAVRDLRSGVAADHQEGAAGPRGGRAAAPGAHAAAHQLHLRRRRLQPASGHGGGAGDQAGHLLPVGRGVVRVRHRGAVGAATHRHDVGRATRADVGVAGIR